MLIQDICRLAPVVPVLVIEDAKTALPLARALIAGGLKALEITLRTPAAFDALQILAEAELDGVIGVGTLRSASDVEAAKAMGARVGVSPGLTPSIFEAAQGLQLPLLPGVATPSEAMAAAERGLEVLKFFPAEANGGASVLKAWSSPLAGLSFCPTGGIGLNNAPDYLSLPNVLCVGGSWVAPKKLVDEGDWEEITKLAKEAAALPRSR